MKKEKFRELSPIVGVSVKTYVRSLPEHLSSYLRKLRRQKRTRTRPKPSNYMVGRSSILTEKLRGEVVDKVASLVDERLFGRHEMCKQFAVLIERALIELGYDAKAVIGIASYENGFQWEHSWVLVENELIDGNADSMNENPLVKKGNYPAPYWGLKDEIPSNRSFTVKTTENEHDPDVEELWWPELKVWLKEKNS